MWESIRYFPVVVVTKFSQHGRNFPFQLGIFYFGDVVASIELFVHYTCLYRTGKRALDYGELADECVTMVYPEYQYYGR